VNRFASGAAFHEAFVACSLHPHRFLELRARACRAILRRPGLRTSEVFLWSAGSIAAVALAGAFAVRGHVSAAATRPDVPSSSPKVTSKNRDGSDNAGPLSAALPGTSSAARRPLRPRSAGQPAHLRSEIDHVDHHRTQNQPWNPFGAARRQAAPHRRLLEETMDPVPHDKWTEIPVTSGRHRLTARVTDEDGNTYRSAPFAVGIEAGRNVDLRINFKDGALVFTPRGRLASAASVSREKSTRRRDVSHRSPRSSHVDTRRGPISDRLPVRTLPKLCPTPTRTALPQHLS